MLPSSQTYYSFQNPFNRADDSQSSLYSYLRKLCCCNTQDQAEYDPLITVENREENYGAIQGLMAPENAATIAPSNSGDSGDSEFHAMPEISFKKTNDGMEVTLQTERLMIESFNLKLDGSLYNENIIMKGNPSSKSFKDVYENPVHWEKMDYEASDEKLDYGLSNQAIQKYLKLAQPFTGYSPLGGFSVSNRENQQYLGYFEFVRASDHALWKGSATELGDFLTLSGIGDHPYWRQGYGQEVAATIQHYLRQCLNKQLVDGQLGANMYWATLNEFKKVEYFVVQIKNNKEVGQILLNIGLEKVDDIPGLNLRRDEGFDFYATKIEDWVNQEIKVKKTSHYSSPTMSNPGNMA